MLRLVLFVALLIPSLSVTASVDVYEFETEQQKQRYQSMIGELRCPKCQNQSLSDSDAPIAQDLRAELHRLLLEGENDKEILAFMVQRYGNFVLYRPPLDKYTFLLWGAPLILLFLGLLVAWRVRTATKQQIAASGLSEEQRQVISELVDNYGKKR